MLNLCRQSFEKYMEVKCLFGLPKENHYNTWQAAWEAAKQQPAVPVGDDVKRVEVALRVAELEYEEAEPPIFQMSKAEYMAKAAIAVMPQQAVNREMLAALRWYADPENWKLKKSFDEQGIVEIVMPKAFFDDEGFRARMVLQVFEQKLADESSPNNTALIRQLVEGLARMNRWFGKYPEFIPNHELMHSVDEAKRMAKEALAAGQAYLREH